MDLFLCILLLFCSTVTSVSATDCSKRPCHFHAKCTPTGNGYKCKCNTGYEGDGKHVCNDVNICNNPNTCGSNSICLYTYGKYHCECKKGYSLNNNTQFGCIDVDECLVYPNICGVNAVCKNKLGSYECECLAGYIKYQTRTECMDYNECTNPKICGENAKCLNNLGSYECECWTGYKKDSLGVCREYDECLSPNICGNNYVCKNTIGSYKCECLAGFVRDLSDTCQDLDECTDLKLCPNNYVCKNSIGSYKCECQAGYEFRDGCIDRDECLDKKICGVDAVCQNTIGSYECKCLAGYAGNPLISCTDIDECLKENDCKSHNAVCVNKIGTYSCVCPTGTTGNPTEQCIAIVETTTKEPEVVEAILQVREMRKLKEDSAPSLNLLFYASEEGKLKFQENHRICLDKSFKIIIHIADSIKARYRFQRLVCYNKTQTTQIYCNDPLEIDINGDYYIKVQNATSTMEAEWRCTIKTNTKLVVLTFHVDFVTYYSKPTLKPLEPSSSNRLTTVPTSYSDLIATLKPLEPSSSNRLTTVPTTYTDLIGSCPPIILVMSDVQDKHLTM